MPFFKSKYLVHIFSISIIFLISIFILFSNAPLPTDCEACGECPDTGLDIAVVGYDCDEDCTGLFNCCGTPNCPKPLWFWWDSQVRMNIEHDCNGCPKYVGDIFFPAFDLWSSIPIPFFGCSFIFPTTITLRQSGPTYPDWETEPPSDTPIFALRRFTCSKKIQIQVPCNKRVFLRVVLECCQHTHKI